MADDLRPKRAIRRFDVFAEYNKLKALREGRPLDEAKGHGLWLAKVVAARRFAPAAARPAPTRQVAAGEARPGQEGQAAAPEAHDRFRSLGDEVQTDQLFDREIVARMGADFYEQVFAPSIARHFERGESYESIRDTVRKDWKPARSSRQAAR